MILPSERASRRPDWTPVGVAVVLADGDTWTIPRLGVARSPDGELWCCVEGRGPDPELTHALLAEGAVPPPGSDEPPLYTAYRTARKRAKMLLQNYAMPVEDAVALVHYGFECRGDYAGQGEAGEAFFGVEDQMLGAIETALADPEAN